MAKLNAYGRTEVARVEKEVPGVAVDSLCDWERYTLALMSDGSILSKMDVRFRSDGQKHSYGWKKRGKLKKGVTSEQWVEFYTTKCGYKRA